MSNQNTTETENIYIQNGYKNRKDYLNTLAEDFCIPRSVVYTLAQMLGETEDFDGLVSSLEDVDPSDFEF